jgi:MFS superfamily sulfate permease-like transporter
LGIFVPGALIAVLAGVTLNALFTSYYPAFALTADALVKLPVAKSSAEFIGQFTLPNFAALSNYHVYVIAVTIAIIASLETLLSVEAVDKLDTHKRVTPTNRELKAQGLGNIVSGLIGGLPITQVVARTGANISFGAKTKMSTISHGFLLLICVIAIPDLLNMIPLATLACVLLSVGYKLAKPAIFKQTYRVGLEQFLPFLATIIGMLYFDLLKGVGIGMGFATFFILRNNYHARNVLQNSEHQEVSALTKEVRDSLTPAKALRILKDGNQRFVNNLKLNRNLLQQINETSEEQQTFALVLS